MRTQGILCSCNFTDHPQTYFKLLIVQCTPDLVTSYLVTNPDLVTILQKIIFLVHKTSHLVTTWYIFSATTI